jgi:hypothetical protein
MKARFPKISDESAARDAGNNKIQVRISESPQEGRMNPDPTERLRQIDPARMREHNLTKIV